ncbi:hypothetical protein R5R35_005032 [Gryllus longicercus]|uniref:C2H2-type domain-containing protein n=2 Tax=Gryllus longicercus TaxID=2509291 RepID=A0AAN9Z9Z8_9ORTH
MLTDFCFLMRDHYPVGKVLLADFKRNATRRTRKRLKVCLKKNLRVLSRARKTPLPVGTRLLAPRWRVNFECPDCERTFGCRVAFNEHRHTHVTGRHECYICHARFSRSESLGMHMRVHRVDAPLRCKVCNATFARRAPLLLHLLVHTEERPFAEHRPWLEHVQMHRLRAHMDNQSYAVAAAQGRPSPAS